MQPAEERISEIKDESEESLGHNIEDKFNKIYEVKRHEYRIRISSIYL